MIKAVFFDLYNTLVHYEPLPGEQQRQALKEHGIESSENDIRRAYWIVGDFFSQENARLSFDKRTEQERQAFWIEYELTLLREAGIKTTKELAISMLQKLRQAKQNVMFFKDSLPTLADLRDRGLTLGIVSNLDRSVEQFCDGLNLTPYVDFAIVSCEAGFEKPDIRIFEDALRKANVQAVEAIHVGDQYHTDISGAHNAGIRALLIDRDGVFENRYDCERISELSQIVGYLYL